MTSNYRLVRHVFRHPTGPEEEYLQVHQVFYDNRGFPKSVTVDPVTIGGEDVAVISAKLNNMLAACQQPILNYRDFDGHPRRVNQSEKED